MGRFYYNYYRDYDPRIGRYLQSDPIGLDDGPNTYSYVDSSPINYVDQNGLSKRRPGAPSPLQSLTNVQARILINQIRQIDPAFRFPVASPGGQGQPVNYSPASIAQLQGFLNNARNAGYCGPGASLPRPRGVPSNWVVRQSRHGGGKRFVDPNNPHNSVRVQPGDPSSPYPNSQNPYVRLNLNGQYRDIYGNPGPSRSPDTHIPLSEFVFPGGG
ncbi:RHS repeat-associated core domain-containing protein [Microbulbifer sp. 2201CG32-9]|uniref:RHS repeat-associated core domain-containing protein n=1 Tax=Microbulbifer sp. 2201CG32-9 TaxID=3232309 RepID=UPI00345B9FE8